MVICYRMTGVFLCLLIIVYHNRENVKDYIYKCNTLPTLKSYIKMKVIKSYYFFQFNFIGICTKNESNKINRTSKIWFK